MAEHPDVDAFPSTRVRHVLSEIEFDVLWDELRLGPTPVVLRLPSPGRTRAERDRITSTGRHGLRRRGLADLAGPAPELARLLRLLAAPGRALELRAWLGQPVRGLAVEHGGHGALAVRRDGTLELSAAGTPAHAIRQALPDRPAGRGPAVSLPTDVLTTILAAGDPGETTAGCPAPGPVAPSAGVPTPDETDRVAALLGGARGRSQVAAVVHDRWGSPRRPVSHVTVLDTPRGRYRLTRAPAGDGTDWSTLAPVDARGLHALLADLLTEADDTGATPGRSAASAAVRPR